MLRADPVRGWTDMQLFSTAAFFLAVCTSLHLTATEPSFDIREYPFSYAGSYMSVMIRQRDAGSREALYIQDVSGERMWGWKGVFRIDPVADGQVLEYAAGATASKVTLRTRRGDVELCYAAPDIIRIRGRGAGIRITQEIGSWSGANFPLNYEKTVWMCKMWGPHYAISVLRGASLGDVATTVVNEAVTGRPQFILDVFPDAEGRWEIALEQFQDAWDGKDPRRALRPLCGGCAGRLSGLQPKNTGHTRCLHVPPAARRLCEMVVGGRPAHGHPAEIDVPVEKLHDRHLVMG
jgi:hypothetical protein